MSDLSIILAVFLVIMVLIIVYESRKKSAFRSMSILQIPSGTKAATGIQRAELGTLGRTQTARLLRDSRY